MSHAPLDPDAGRRDIADLDRIVGRGKYGLREILANLVPINVKGGDELYVANVIATQVDVHKPRNEVVSRRVLIIAHPLHQR